MHRTFRDLEALGVLDALSCYLSLILKHSDKKWETRKHSRSFFFWGGGGRLVRPLWICYWETERCFAECGEALLYTMYLFDESSLRGTCWSSHFESSLRITPAWLYISVSHSPSPHAHHPTICPKIGTKRLCISQRPITGMTSLWFFPKVKISRLIIHTSSPGQMFHKMKEIMLRDDKSDLILV